MSNKTIKFGSAFGNFKWEAEAEVTDEQLAILAPLGALQVGQRSPSTAAEKEMAKYDKRPKGFSRDSIPFSKEGAAILEKHMGSLEIADGVSIDCVVNVVEYVGGEGAQVKFAYERKLYGNKAAKLQALADMVDYTGELGSGVAAEAPEAFLQAIKDWSNRAD